MTVEEAHTTVVRFAVCRDEIDKKWETVIAKPVRLLVPTVQALQPKTDGTSPIMDVWDRQYLSEKLEKTRPADANIFHGMLSFALKLTISLRLRKHLATRGAMQSQGPLAVAHQPAGTD